MLRLAGAIALSGAVVPSASGCSSPPVVAVTGTAGAERAVAYRALAEQAIPLVEDLWGHESVPLPIRLDLPATTAAWAAATGHQEQEQGYSASTVRSNPSGSPDQPPSETKIVIHPRAWSQLSPEGRLAIIVHEVTHLVMGSEGEAPWWLGEGIAEYTAHRSSERSLQQITGSAWEQVITDPPEQWPIADPGEPWQGYARAWLACVFIAETTSEEDLLALYQAVSAGQSLNDACLRLFAQNETDLHREWTRWLSAQ